MDLIQRYLQAVKPFLPRAQQDDILAELSEDIRSQIEDRETELGRKLDEDELAAIIKKRGQPMLVAGSYLPRQHLIGPVWFPAYRFVLKLVMLWIQLPVFMLIVAPVVYFTARNPKAALLEMVRGLPETALATFAVITLIFVCMERYQFRSLGKSLEDWDPRKLPSVRVATPNLPGPRSVAISELVWGIIFTLGWMSVAWFHYGLDAGNMRMTLASVWRNSFWPILFLMMSGIPAGCVGLFKPAWTRLHSSFRLMIDGYSLILLGLLFKAGTSWVEVTSAKLPAAQVAEIAHGFNLGVRIAFLVIAIIVLADVIQEVYRIVRVKTLRPWTANGLAAS
jgi:hypothetical protein